ncbi:oxygen-independent coproporphyrinogen III oxidase [Devosia sp.]|uniref:oxygen-independent coproporphyrinogen III oxidase n=1 Tax=Devosia sp. TaxID=1871048 RepID=UPI003A94CBF8
MSDALLRRFSRPVPRYTSYPTAPHFHPGVDQETYARWLGEIPADTALSLYLHVPFCDRLCWFCGCHTKQVARYAPIAAYLPMLRREMETVAGLLDGAGRTTALHLGGGSPSMLRAEDLLDLVATIRRNFTIADNFEFSLEIDPNDVSAPDYDGLAAAGVSRISIGVQDFNDKVQQAINRIQTFDQTKAVVDGMRARGVNSVNLDVLYGLPHQTLETIGTTVDQALSLNPERIALFGYAHVPWMKTHQKMIDESVLPGPEARLEQSLAAARKILDAGYIAIGIDHFARPDDGLARAAAAGELHRNFQGYTTDAAPALLGFGASSVGSLPQGYVQNTVPTGDYMRQVAVTGLATGRGVALSEEDRMRRWVIERLMCDFEVPVSELGTRFGPLADQVLDQMQAAASADEDGVVDFDGTTFRVTDTGRPFVRSVAAGFDSYLGNGAGRHSAGV